MVRVTVADRSNPHGPKEAPCAIAVKGGRRRPSGTRVPFAPYPEGMRAPSASRRTRARIRRLPVVAPALAAIVLGCARVEAVLERRTRATPHEAYTGALAAAGLEDTELARRWLAAARNALARPTPIDAPYEEHAYFPAEDPSAAGYRLALRNGHSLRVVVEPTDSLEVRVFLDLYRVEAEGGMEHLASAEPGANLLEFEPASDGDVVLRVQPELLRSVRLRLRVIRAGTLAFPVDGRDEEAIRSVFGAPREAGRREHHGVDIFAPRGTPVLAPSDGVVARVGTNRLGGNVIWMRDARRRQSFYFAHLERQLVREGRRVRAGDTLGLVGNSGNARTTPPHLHFGIYRRGRGPVDPHPFIASPPEAPARTRVSVAGLGGWVRTTAPARARPAGGGEERAVPTSTVVRLLGVARREYRVALPDGTVASLRGGGVEPIGRSTERLVLVGVAGPVLEAPRPDAVTMDAVASSDTLAVLGRYGAYVLVERGGLRGWVAAGQ